MKISKTYRTRAKQETHSGHMIPLCNDHEVSKDKLKQSQICSFSKLNRWYQKLNFVKESMGPNWNFQRGVGTQTKKRSVGGVWIFLELQNNCSHI